MDGSLKIPVKISTIVILLTVLVSCTSGGSERKAEMYMVLYEPLTVYIEGQELARERTGTYMQLFYMVQDGYLPGGFPRTSPEYDTYFKLIETNITADTFTVEVRGLGPHFDSFRMESLWSDESGVIRVGSQDGEEFEVVFE